MTDLQINVEGRDRGASTTVAAVRREIDRLASELRKLEGSLQGSAQELAQSIELYRQASRESIALKGEWNRLRASGEGNEQMFADLGARIGKAQAQERELIEETRRLAGVFQSSEGETEQWADQLRFLGEQLDKSQGHIDGVSVEAKRNQAQMSRMGDAVNRVGDEMREMGGDTRRAADSLDRVENEAAQANKELRKMNDNALHVRAAANVLSEGFEEAIYFVKQFAEESIQAFYDTDRGIREITTLIPGATGQMREDMLADIQAMSIELGRMSGETIPAVYNALSSGRGSDTVLQDVALASQAARAGVAELDDTMKAGLAVLNAYGEGSYTLQNIYDQFFFGIKEGVFTMSDLAGGMSALTSVSAETRTPLEDIMSLLVVMTRQGDDFNEAVELSGLLLTQLGTEGSAAANAFVASAGKSYRQFIAEGGTLAEALQLIQAHADATGQSIGSMIAGNSPFYRDQQAARAALELTGVHLQEVADSADQARESQGSMAEASAIMGNAAETDSLKAAAAWDILKSQAGEALLSANLLGFGFIDTGINIQNALNGAVVFMQRFTGAMATETENIIDDNLAHAKSVADLVAEYQKLDAADKLYLGLGDVITGTAGEINDGKEQIINALAEQAASFDEYIEALDAIGIAEAGAVGAERAYWEEIYNTVHAQHAAAAANAIEREEKQRSIAVMREARQVREAEAETITRVAGLTNTYDTNLRRVNRALIDHGVSLNATTVPADELYYTTTELADATHNFGDEIDQTNAKLNEEALALAQYWEQSQALVSGWVAAQDQGEQAILESNAAISQSYEDVFFNALLSNAGLSESTLALMVSRGLLTQQEADFRLEVSQNNQALVELTNSQDFLKLSTEQQNIAIDALKNNMAQSAEAAIALATDGYAPLAGEIANSKQEAILLNDELDYMNGLTVDPEFLAPDLSGAISQAERLNQLYSDLESKGSAGGYGGNINENGGVGGGANMPTYAQGGYTGEAGGLVHPKEFVFDQKSTAFFGQDLLHQMQMAGQDNRQFNLGGDTYIINDFGGGQTRQVVASGAAAKQDRLYKSLRFS